HARTNRWFRQERLQTREAVPADRWEPGRVRGVAIEVTAHDNRLRTSRPSPIAAQTQSSSIAIPSLTLRQAHCIHCLEPVRLLVTFPRHQKISRTSATRGQTTWQKEEPMVRTIPGLGVCVVLCALLVP